MRRMAGVLLGFALVISGCMNFDFFHRADRPLALGGPRIGAAAPEIEGDDFDGQHLKLSDYRGKVVVLVFWFSGCRPCRELIPHEKELAQRYRDRPFAVVGVNNDEDPEAARRLIAAQGMTWRIVQSNGYDNAITRRWRVNAWPAIFVIDAKGTLRYKQVFGPNLDNAVESLLAEAEKR